MAVVLIQILNELKDSLHIDGIEEVRLIRDKKTGKSAIFACLVLPDVCTRTIEAVRFCSVWYDQ